jgi:hypothetical protein
VQSSDTGTVCAGQGQKQGREQQEPPFLVMLPLDLVPLLYQDLRLPTGEL